MSRAFGPGFFLPAQRLVTSPFGLGVLLTQPSWSLLQRMAGIAHLLLPHAFAESRDFTNTSTLQ
jgi:hypothetical protein